VLVLVEKLCDGHWMWDLGELVLLGDLFPVVHEDGFESIRDEDFDCWFDKVVFLLRGRVSGLY
jgi:hypothetical protein